MLFSSRHNLACFLTFVESYWFHVDDTTGFLKDFVGLVSACNFFLSLTGPFQLLTFQKEIFIRYYAVTDVFLWNNMRFHKYICEWSIYVIFFSFFTTIAQ